MKTTQKTYKVKLYGKEYEIWLDKTEYLNNKTLAVQADCDEGPFATITVNLGHFLQGKDYAYVDTNNCPWAEEFLTSNGLAEPTGIHHQSGWCEYPLYKFNIEKF